MGDQTSCGCGCGAAAPKSAAEGIADLQRLRDNVEQRLAQLESSDARG